MARLPTITGARTPHAARVVFSLCVTVPRAQLYKYWMHCSYPATVQIAETQNTIDGIMIGVLHVVRRRRPVHEYVRYKLGICLFDFNIFIFSNFYSAWKPPVLDIFVFRSLTDRRGYTFYAYRSARILEKTTE
jgi:hypothetical protein